MTAPIRPKMSISMVSASIPIGTPHSTESNPCIKLEICTDRIAVWDEVDYLVCGAWYSFTGPPLARGCDIGPGEIINIPYFDHVYRYIVNQYAVNRGNPLGRHLCRAVAVMDSEIARRDGSSVYLVRAGNWIKIGWSRNVGARISQLQTGNADPIELIATISGGRALERQLHERFADSRVSGEWFKYGPELANYVASLNQPAHAHIASI
jgi:hypothetical protein